MAVSVDYVDGGRGVIVRQSEIVTGEEIIAAQKGIYKKHKQHCQQYHIIDKSWCTEYAVDASELAMISRLDCKMTEHNCNIIMAVIESNYLQYSLTDVWQAYVSDVIKYSKSFNNQVGALGWIKQLLQEIQYELVFSKHEFEYIKQCGYEVS
ncbi:MAG: hypothetical protein OQL19_06425 [Gammaproteobacteria bacterium]|nr:hypothetical protein [Gammaproteobacteria bacterium]